MDVNSLDVNSLDWNDLRFFVAVARSGSLAKAATKLGVTHSTVFRRINSLEGAINMKLFARMSSGYELTDAGREMLSYAEQVADRIDGLLRYLANSHELQGTINVTAPHNLAYRYLPGYIQEFRQLYPDIRINLLVGNSDLNLSRREADVAIRATTSPPDNLIGYKLFSLAWGAYAAESYLSQHGVPLDVDDLQQHQLISANSDLGHLPVFGWLDRKLPGSCIVMRCSDLVSMSAAAVAGIGIAPLPDDQAKPELRRCFGLPEDVRSDIWLLIHPDLRHSHRLKLFREFMIRKFQEDSVFQQHGLHF